MANNTAIPKKQFLITNASAGVSVTIGTLKFMIPSSGNRSLQIATTSGNATLQIHNTWGDGGAGDGFVNIIATTTWKYANSSWHFGNAGMWQRLIINDHTNYKWYEVIMEIGSSYNNNQYYCKEL